MGVNGIAVPEPGLGVGGAPVRAQPNRLSAV